MTVPNFALALMLVDSTNLACMLPRRFAAAHALEANVVLLDPPVPFSTFRMHLVVQEQALRDAGIAWLVETIEAAARSPG